MLSVQTSVRQTSGRPPMGDGVQAVLCSQMEIVFATHTALAVSNHALVTLKILPEVNMSSARWYLRPLLA